MVDGAVILVELDEAGQPHMGEVVQHAVQIGAMIRLDAVLQLRLPVPVAALDLGDRHRDHLVDMVGLERLGQLAERRRQRLGVGIEIGEDEAVPDLDLVRGQMRLRLQPLQADRVVHRGRRDQMAVEAVGPGVERAAEQASGVARALAQQMAAMRADRREDADLHVLVAHHDERLVAHVDAHEIAGVLDLVHPAQAQPASHEDGFLLEIVEFLVDIAFTRQVPAALHVLHAVLDLVEDPQDAIGYARASRAPIAVVLAVHLLPPDLSRSAGW